MPSDCNFISVLPSERVNGLAVANANIVRRFKVQHIANEWISRKMNERTVLYEHGRLCQVWQDSIRRQRRDAMLDRLEEIGWREEAERSIQIQPHRNPFSDHILVDQPKTLTEHNWNSIEDELVQMLSAYKKKRLAEEYREITSESDLRNPSPALGDILTNNIFEDLVWDTPQDDLIRDDFFRDRILEHIPHIIEEWRPSKVGAVVDIMRRSVPGATANDLHLATCS
ncbi:hypothetical protein BT96DRAFT_1012661 [Gymnopus androsaceus JB14]|uniref:Uncharacterized protein n=1 Tax=Gymnopus androsaceus JB14 TaxID=1447944 RepID=A0A6A4IJB1_9AGAR|nr:hypothetical protein BT96DRAFT_1012661 [Gymnopus androsaceus JB14]